MRRIRSQTMWSLSGNAEACYATNGVPTITTVAWCPVRGDLSLSCADSSTLSKVWAAWFCSWIAPSITLLPIMRSSKDGMTSTSMMASQLLGGFSAYRVRMVSESSDLPASTTSMSSSTLTESSGATGSVLSSTSSANVAGAGVHWAALPMGIQQLRVCSLQPSCSPNPSKNSLCSSRV